jgi:hypothetical protein
MHTPNYRARGVIYLPYLHLAYDLYPGGDGELGLLLLPPQQKVVVREGVLPVQQQVHQVLRHLHQATYHLLTASLW